MLFTILRVFLKPPSLWLTGEGVLACITGALSQARQTRLFARSSKRINFQSSKSSQKLTSRTFFSLTTKTSWQAELSSHKRLNAYFLLINEQQKARNMSRSYWISWSFLASPKKTYSWKAALIPFSWLENTYPWVHVPDFYQQRFAEYVTVHDCFATLSEKVTIWCFHWHEFLFRCV